MSFSFPDDEPIRLRNARDADPDVIGKALTEVAALSGGDFKPQDVVDSAKSQKHPLHKFFEWDDAVAGNAYRLGQARALIRIVRVNVPEREEPTRAFFSVKDSSGQRYRPVRTIIESGDLQQSLLKAAKRDLQAFQARYSSILELCEPIAKAMRAIDIKISGASAPPPPTKEAKRRAGGRRAA